MVVINDVDYTIGPKANLEGANLTGADLTGANLYGAKLEGANLTDVKLTGANLYGAILIRANLYGAILIRAKLTNAISYFATLTGANLTGANLTGAILTGANLSGANLYGAILIRANLKYADLTGADLTDANLTNVKSGSITGNPLSLPNDYKMIKGYIVGPDVDLTGANLTDANLKNVDLTGADLTDVNLTGADLTDANLKNVDLTDANLTDANLTDADLTGADLTDANLTGAILTDALYNEKTKGLTKEQKNSMTYKSLDHTIVGEGEGEGDWEGTLGGAEPEPEPEPESEPEPEPESEPEPEPDPEPEPEQELYYFDDTAIDEHVDNSTVYKSDYSTLTNNQFIIKCKERLLTNSHEIAFVMNYKEDTKDEINYAIFKTSITNAHYEPKPGKKIFVLEKYKDATYKLLKEDKMPPANGPKLFYQVPAQLSQTTVNKVTADLTTSLRFKTLLSQMGLSHDYMSYTYQLNGTHAQVLYALTLNFSNTLNMHFNENITTDLLKYVKKFYQDTLPIQSDKIYVNVAQHHPFHIHVQILKSGYKYDTTLGIVTDTNYIPVPLALPTSNPVVTATTPPIVAATSNPVVTATTLPIPSIDNDLYPIDSLIPKVIKKTKIPMRFSWSNTM